MRADALGEHRYPDLPGRTIPQRETRLPPPAEGLHPETSRRLPRIAARGPLPRHHPRLEDPALRDDAAGPGLRAEGRLLRRGVPRPPLRLRPLPDHPRPP